MVNFVTDINLDDPKFYRNRELSWLQFDLRVLDEAKDDLNPLFERMRFLSISASRAASRPPSVRARAVTTESNSPWLISFSLRSIN